MYGLDQPPCGDVADDVVISGDREYRRERGAAATADFIEPCKGVGVLVRMTCESDVARKQDHIRRATYGSALLLSIADEFGTQMRVWVHRSSDLALSEMDVGQVEEQEHR